MQANSNKLTQILIAPANRSIAKGNSLQLSATGMLGNGTSESLTALVTWTVSPSKLASIDAQGSLKALGEGTAQISATYEGVTGTATTTIGPPTLLSISVVSQRANVPLGESDAMTATGSLSDGTTQNLTPVVSWQVSPSTVASINAEGDLKGLSKGAAQVTATYQGTSGSASITIGTAAFVGLAVSGGRSSLPLGESEAMTATGTFSDGTTQNFTNSASWQVSPSTIASIDSQGNLKTLGKGVAKVSATYQGMSGSASITVGSAALLGIAVAGHQSSLPVGESESLTATGTFSDGTMQTLTQLVDWSSSQSAIATVSASGSVLAKSVGASTISATAGSVSGSASLTVTAAVPASLSIAPASSSVILANSTQLSATATYSDGSTKDWTSTVAWSSAPAGIVNVGTAGGVTGQQVGTATVSANGSGLTASASVTVTPLMMVSYFNRSNSATTGFDGTVRLVNPAFPTGGLCAMVYVFDQNQELNECCGCQISDDGLLTLSLLHDLTANTLTGKKPVAGEIEIVPSNPSQGGQCNAGSLSPNGMLAGSETNVQNTTVPLEVTETVFPLVNLSNTQAQVLAAECSLMQQLGSGQGVCSCGTGD